MKRQLMQIANQLRKNGFTLSAALKRAWYALRLKAKMAIKPVSFFYAKEKGEERFAIGHYGSAPATATPPKPNKSILAIPYFDTLVEDWRSFRVDRLICD